MKIPFDLTAGDSATWQDDPCRVANGRMVSAPSFTLLYALRGSGDGVDLTAQPAANGWQTSISTTQSAALNTGNQNAIWFWHAYAISASERINVGSGKLTVRPNFAAMTAPYDGRTTAEQHLDAVTNEIGARVNGGATVEYSIGNRSLKKEPIAELIKLRDRLQMDVNRQRKAERVANGAGTPGKLFVRFGRG